MSQKESFTASVWARLLSILFIIGLAVVSYVLIIRPWHEHWGATTQEAARPMPGDEIVAGDSINFTRAVTIYARPEEIWPWLIQMGHQRAGFYSYDWFDNGGLRSAETILPEFQILKEGDLIPISDAVIYRVRSMADEQYLVWASTDNPPSGTWTWALYPIDDEQTRLITRLRGSIDWDFPGVFLSLLVDSGDIAFMRKSMLGIKQRAEGAITDSYATDVIEGVLWGITAVEFVVAILLIFTSRLWWQPWLCAVGAALAFLTIFYLRPPIWMMVILVGVVLIGLVGTYRFPSKQRIERYG